MDQSLLPSIHTYFPKLDINMGIRITLWTKWTLRQFNMVQQEAHGHSFKWLTWHQQIHMAKLIHNLANAILCSSHHQTSQFHQKQSKLQYTLTSYRLQNLSSELFSKVYQSGWPNLPSDPVPLPLALSLVPMFCNNYLLWTKLTLRMVSILSWSH